MANSYILSINSNTFKPSIQPASIADFELELSRSWFLNLLQHPELFAIFNALNTFSIPMLNLYIAYHECIHECLLASLPVCLPTVFQIEIAILTRALFIEFSVPVNDSMIFYHFLNFSSNHIFDQPLVALN